MRDAWAHHSSQGLTQGTTHYGARLRNTSFLASKAMRLKLSGHVSREVSERRQVGDAEAMFAESGGERPWWRNVTMEEGV